MKLKKIAAVLALLFAFTIIRPAFADDSLISSANYQRLQGKDRYETAVSISNNGWQNGSDYVIVASGENFADALCSIPLAKKYNAPVLLTRHDYIPDSTLNEIERLKVKHVIIVGGEGAVSKKVENKINISISTKPEIVRIWGKDRFETSVKIAQELGSVDTVALASGNTYPDALSVSSIAAIKGMPILLTGKDALPAGVEEFIRTNKPNTYIIGLEGAVSKSVEELINNITSHQPIRLGGTDRYGTNVKVMQEFQSSFNFNYLFVATGDGPNGNEFADALSGAALAAQKGSPVVLAYRTLPQLMEDYLRKEINGSTFIIAIGGKAALSDDIVNRLVLLVSAKNSQGGQGSSSCVQYGSNPLVSVYNKNVTIDYKDSNTGDCYVTIQIYLNGTQNYKYINQSNFVNGKCQFNVILDAGTYDGKINVNGTSFSLPEFTVY